MSNFIGNNNYFFYRKNKQSYANYLVSMGANEVWPMVNATESNIIPAYVNRKRDGIQKGLSLQNVVTPIGRSLAPSMATGSCGSIYSSNGVDGFSDIFNGTEGSLWIMFKPVSATWSETKYIYYIGAKTGVGFISARISNTGDIIFNFKSTDTGSTKIMSTNAFNGVTDWLYLGLSWSKTANQVKAYVFRDGVGGGQISTTQTWSGTLPFGTLEIGYCSIGTHDITPDFAIQGSFSYLACKFGSVWSASDFYNMYSNSPEKVGDVEQQGKRRFSFLGDSITVGYGASWFPECYANLVSKNFFAKPFNHAVGGTGLVDANGLNGQTVLAANDNADIIILAFGTNDNNNGNVNTYISSIQNNVDLLRLSNPNATIYYMNVLPSWNADKITPRDKSNIRSAIITACESRSVTCWDTFTTPWILASDTMDGLHPNTGGYAKIANEIISRIS